MPKRWICLGIICLFVVIAGQITPAQEEKAVEHPCLLANADEIVQAKKWLAQYDWYREILEKEKVKIDKFIARPIYVSPLKQEWSYDSYNCPEDKSLLEFDETKPFEHKCPMCGKVYNDHKFNATWAGKYNNLLGKHMRWLGILYQMTGEEKYAQTAHDILVKFAELYLQYSDQNNILGPARVFFSTLNEAIWAINMASGYDFVYNSPCFSIEDRKLIKEKFFYPLSEIVQKFPETVSNRQLVYNNAVAAIGFLYSDKRLIGIAFNGKYGYKYQLRVGMSRDGFWSEGSGYHFFSLLSFCTFAEMARHHGIDYYHMTIADHYLKDMFDAPFNVVSPDFRFPRIRDGGGALLINRGPWYELAFARYGDPRYAELLNYIYKTTNKPRKPLFFFALNPELPGIEGDIYPEESFNLDETGWAILRDKVNGDNKYLYLDYGIVGGEHGHPDRLSIGYYTYGQHWLMDPRNESYAFPNLQTWYRQTVAHNTIVVNESKQAWTNGYYKFFGETAGLKVASGGADHLYGGVKMTRTVILVGDYFLDLFDVAAAEPRTYDLPYHSFGILTTQGVELEKQPIDLFGHLPGIQGYDQFTQIKKGVVDNDWQAIFRKEDGTGMTIRMLGSEGTLVYTAMTPGISNAYDVRLPVVMSRRYGPVTRFESLIEGFKDKPSVTGFVRKTGTDSYIVIKDDEEHTITAEVTDSRYCVIKKKGGELKQISGFNTNCLLDNAGRVLISADFVLDHLDIVYEKDKVIVAVPPDFGRIKIYSPEINHFVVNDKHYEITREEGEDYCEITQEDKDIVVRLLEPQEKKIFLGLDNTIRLGFYNYADSSTKIEPGLQLAEGWQEKLQAQLDYWGGIVNLVATNKTDPRQVLSPQQFPKLSFDWASNAQVETVSVEAGSAQICDLVLAPGHKGMVAGRYEIVPVWKSPEGKTHKGKSMVFDVVEPITADIFLPNGKSHALGLTLKNNTSRELSVEIEIKPSLGWRLTGETKTQIEIPPGEGVVHEIDARLTVYKGDEQLYPIEFSVSCGKFTSTIRKDFYIGICHWAEEAPLLDGGFKGWNTSKPMIIDRANQVCRLLVGTQPWCGKQDLSAKVYAMYDKDYLYMGCEVTDNKVVEHFDPRMRWPFDPDNVEVILDVRTNSEQGADPMTEGTFRHLALPEYRTVRFDPSMPLDLSVWFRQIDGTETFYKKTEQGYNMIVRIPLACMSQIVPTDGCKIGFDLSISDNDGTLYRKNEHIWAGYNQNQSWLDLGLIGALIFRK